MRGYIRAHCKGAIEVKFGGNGSREQRRGLRCGDGRKEDCYKSESVKTYRTRRRVVQVLGLKTGNLEQDDLKGEKGSWKKKTLSDGLREKVVWRPLPGSNYAHGRRGSTP